MINELTIYQAALYLGVPLPGLGYVRMSIDQYQRRYGAAIGMRENE
jgi:hypothetical protein